MKVAVITYVYNESVNLPIWIKYFGRNFGEANLFVVDRGSNDGSTENLGSANRVLIPRNKFDEYNKTGFINSLHRALLYEYDAVIYTDCDEIIVPDPAMYSNLADYLGRMNEECVAAVGLNIHHLITHEPPLDLGQPLLSQRRHACFLSAECKTLISRAPITWLPGFHCSNRPPKIDTNLFNFHFKYMDYGIAMARQKINRETEWSEKSLDQNFGAHHRYGYERFVREGFLDPVNVVFNSGLEPFDFGEKVQRLMSGTREVDGYHYIPMDVMGWVQIPDRFANSI